MGKASLLAVAHAAEALAAVTRAGSHVKEAAPRLGRCNPTQEVQEDMGVDARIRVRVYGGATYYDELAADTTEVAVAAEAIEKRANGEPLLQVIEPNRAQEPGLVQLEGHGRWGYDLPDVAEAVETLSGSHPDCVFVVTVDYDFFASATYVLQAGEMVAQTAGVIPAPASEVKRRSAA